jgi:DNA-binding LytR/AlgR family response regulator
MIKCLIVDDEEPARNLIRLHLSGLDGFEVIASLNNGLDAFTFLQKHMVDLVFLDINMPKISGLELVRSLKHKPQIIMTTAYREHAALAYDLDILDYLVKPITKERFMKAISKYLQNHSSNESYMPLSANNPGTYHFFKVGRGQIKIFLKDIIFIEGLSDYVKVHTTDYSYIVSGKLNYLEGNLPNNQFIRIHKSFIIALDRISSYNAVQVSLDIHVLPLGRLFKGSFMKKIQSRIKANKPLQ